MAGNVAEAEELIHASTDATELDLSDLGLDRLPESLWRCTSLTDLDLRKNRLTSLPESVGRLTNLKVLNVSGNRLTALPESVGLLTGLGLVDLSDNQLTTLPESLGQLTHLGALDLRDNQLSSLPESVGQLTKLVGLDLAWNRLTTLPDFIGRLTRLELLYLIGNQLTTLPETVGQLTALRVLDLRDNQVTTLPESVGQLTSLTNLLLGDNPLPNQVLALASRSLDDLRAHLLSLGGPTRPLREAKLLLVGDPAVGKTSLRDRLLGEGFIPDRDTTHGMEVRELELADAPGGSITLKLWDFGGQDKYRITHPFFFSSQSIYVIAWNPRVDSTRDSISDWIDRIQRCVGDEVHVVVTATHRGARDHRPNLDSVALQRRFQALPTLTFHQIDSQPDAVPGLSELRSDLERLAAGLRHVSEPVNAQWVRARESLLSRSEPHARFEDLEAEAAAHGLSREDTRALLNLMDIVGDVVYFPGDPTLEHSVVLQPEWLTKAIAHVLNDVRSENDPGVRSHRELAAIWTNPELPEDDRYDPRWHPFLLRLMEKFDISHRLEGGEASLISPLVPHAPPMDETWPPPDMEGAPRVQRRIRLRSPAPGIVHWLIARTHWYSSELHWQTGLILQAADRGWVRIEQDSKGLWFDGAGNGASGFVDELTRTAMKMLEDRWRGSDPTLEVPCSEADCTGTFKVDLLFKRRNTERTHFDCSQCGEPASVEELLTGVTRSSEEDSFRLLQQGIVESNRQTVSHAVSVLLNALASEAQRGPRLFSLHPLDAKWHDVGKIRLGLTLWCEHLQDRHPCDETGRYEHVVAKDWLRKAAPYLNVVSKLLVHSLPIAGATAGTVLDQAGLLDSVRSELNLMGLLARAFACGQAELGDGLDLRGLPGRGASGDGLRQLHALLDELDPARTWGGLRRVPDMAGDFIWVCPRHHALHDRGLPGGFPSSDGESTSP